MKTSWLFRYPNDLMQRGFRFEASCNVLHWGLGFHIMLNEWSVSGVSLIVGPLGLFIYYRHPTMNVGGAGIGQQP